MSILEEGPVRRFFKNLRNAAPGSTITPSVDGQIASLREAKYVEWKAKGYPEALIDKAFLMADNWISSQAAAWAPPDRPDVKVAIIQSAYPKSLEVAEAWIQAMMK